MKNRMFTIIIGFVVPFCAIILCFPIYNRIEPFVLGFSFNYFWLFAWLPLTALCLFIAYKADPLNRAEAKALGNKRLLEVKELIKTEIAEKNKEEVMK